MMSVLDAMGCDRAEDIFSYGEGGDWAISGNFSLIKTRSDRVGPRFRRPK